MPNKKKKLDWSFYKNGILGYNLTINPQPPLAPSAGVYRQFLEHGIVISDKELNSILSGRDQAVGTINTILNTIHPNLLGPELNLKLSNTVADALLSKSLRGSLSREVPTVFDRLDQQDAVLNQISPRPSTGPLPHLFDLLPPVGFSVTINFDWP